MYRIPEICLHLETIYSLINWPTLADLICIYSNIQLSFFRLLD